ncbi:MULTISPECIES: hypothetical protein, partial [Providencia]|uniref:hypothetical protein n=1 Tax=Providencia TaxID=586 RepID=UPI001AAFE0FD
MVKLYNIQKQEILLFPMCYWFNSVGNSTHLFMSNTKMGLVAKMTQVRNTYGIVHRFRINACLQMSLNGNILRQPSS